ncbi:PREDICTED: pre-mRNA-splicing factor CWC25 homolog [Drosophila arizonae]|uniref:Pre-mRNA-splicing factor CWC25 homolog n=1 Tax=Drosophila arizonae TaxID=7263 RepID=A0ABM1NTL5_DROAR|nr:PREDICTED: pre-mRNA-splicing factor CWC25 homolog [Drosophila arizonae]
MGGGDLNLKKSWHPHTMKNQERVWKAEQAKQEEQRKLDDLRKEINEERDREELRRIGENSGVLNSSNGGEAKLEWMYKNSAELINREEYLLGRKIDKSFEQLQAEEKRQEQNTLGVKQSINHVEHECVPFSIREYRNMQSTEQVDMQRKTMEDPLMLIKQREMESRRKLLENPVKLKEIHRLLKTEQELAAKRNKKSKKSKKSKKKKNRKDDSDDSNEDLDRKLAKQMKKLKGDNTSEDFKLDKLLDAKYRTLTKQLDMATKQKKQKSKKKSKRPNRSSSSSSSSDDSDSSEEASKAGRRRRSKSRSRSSEDQPRRANESRDRRNSSDSETRSKKIRESKCRRERSADEREKKGRRGDSRSNERTKSSKESRGRQRSSSRTDERTKRENRRPEERRRRSSSHSPRRDQRQRSRSNERRRPSPKPAMAPPPPLPRQPEKAKPKLTESEREARLREMMDNAVWREADRTKVVHKHRKEYAREEALNQARDFDQQFINKEVKKAIDNQTSIGNRIRSNLNNIQRTSAAMDANFARK